MSNFDSKIQFIESLRQQVNSSIQNTSNRIDHFESKLTQIVKAIIAQDIKQRMAQYEAVAKSFQKFFDQDTL